MHNCFVSRGVFALVPNGESTDELVKAGNYDFADKRITAANFPINSKRVRTRIIELFSVERGVTRKSSRKLDVFNVEVAFKRAARRALCRPTIQDALLFGAQHWKGQEGRSIIFPHEPWVNSDNQSVVIHLHLGGYRKYGDENRERDLWLDFLRLPRLWGRDLFAFAWA